MNNPTRFTPGLHAVPLLLVMVFSAGWTNRLRPIAEHMPQAELMEQSRRMTALHDAATAENSDLLSIKIDLADADQYRFVESRLRAAGKDERNSPALFSKLVEFREKALARKASEIARAKDSNTRPAAASAIWCDHYLLTNPPEASNNGNTMTYQPYVRVSCKGGANYVYTDLVVYDVNQAETESRRVASESGEEYGGGTDFIGVKTKASVNVTAGRLLRLESMALAVDDKTGQDVSYYTVARTSIAVRQDGSFTLLHPRETVPNAQAEILLCQLRGGSDCDYAVAGRDARGTLVAYPSGSTPTGVAASRSDVPGALSTSDYWAFSQPYNAQRLYVPIRVDINAGVRNYLQCTVDSYSYAKVKLHTENGDTCANAVDFRGLLPVGRYNATFNYLADVSYNINGNGNQDCPATLILNKAVSFSILIIGKAKCTDASGVVYFEPFTKTQTIDGLNTKTRKLFYRNSCMAAGTQVRMADGQVLPVEQVKVGDKVLTGAGRNALTVMDVAQGNENSPLIRLKDSAGHELTLTEKHPVIRAHGEVVAADTLRVNDRVRTDQGTATLTSVSRVPVDGTRVYNLRLGTPEELKRVSAVGRTLLADGILVGDLSMQEDLERPAQKPADVLALLPKAWHQDFKNARAR